MAHLRRLYAYENTDYMALDASTKRNLELTTTMQEGGSDGTLVSILDDTTTAMGGRLLRKWINRPLKKVQSIQKRLEAVDWIYKNQERRYELREEMGQIGDLERLISRISVGRTNARDLKQLQLSLAQVPRIKAQISQSGNYLLDSINSRLKMLIEVQERIENALIEDPPASIRDGGIFSNGFDENLDELREIARNGKKYIAEIKNKLAKETGISSLKIGYNKVFGYYIEVTNTHKDKVPEHFIRKQTLVNSERYITPELKDVEEKVLSAEDKSKTLEGELFEELRLYVAEFADDIQQLATALAELDCLQCFAEVSFRNNYVRPEVNDEDIIDVKKGRHPVVEKTLPAGEPFIPNDIYLDNSEYQILMITGPNMAGKSIILRQTGLLVLMAQLGCFVPAKEAKIGLVDKIFTRVGASDNLAAGESTFLVEMNEAANILNNATERSLIILDEIGRGTSTFDGLALAWACAVELVESIGAFSLFATHYFELTALPEHYPRAANIHLDASEYRDHIVFLHSIQPGPANRSYGLQVAKLAGIPAAVVHAARGKLDALEQGVPPARSGGDPAPEQSDLFSAPDPLRETLADVEPDALTPREALDLIYRLKKSL